MKKTLLSIFVGFFCFTSLAQEPPSWSSIDIYQNLKELNFLGTVLYVGAHPDDENTRLISYFSNKMHARVGYLSLTRGDGGQNLIGPQIREMLGVLRTQELLAARKIDGGVQFFSRANDFGYSKTPKETFNIWNKHQVLADVVRVIRKFQPDIIINRFSQNSAGKTHGHHTASAMLSVKAFDWADNPDKFPKTAGEFGTWQPEKLYFNTSYWFYGSKEAFSNVDKSNFAKINVGKYLPLLGKSNIEISAHSRSQHKSQGFGISAKRGNNPTYLKPTKGDFHGKPKNLFKGINTSWSRVRGGATIGTAVQEIINNYKFTDPAASLPELIEVYRMIKSLDPGYWRRVKLKEVKTIIAGASGIYLRASTAQMFGVPGGRFKLNIEATNRSDFPIRLKKLSYKNFEAPEMRAQVLPENEPFYFSVKGEIDQDVKYSTPYWLKTPADKGMYHVTNKRLIGFPETPNRVAVEFVLNYKGIQIPYKRPVVFRNNDPVKGEVFKPFDIVPKISLHFKNKNYIFPTNKTKTIKVKVQAHQKNIKGELVLQAPNSWKIKPESIPLNFEGKGGKTVTFQVNPPKNTIQSTVKPIFKTSKRNYTFQLKVMDYSHIPQQAVLLPASAKLIRLSINIGHEKVGYIEGAADQVAENLRLIGYDVEGLTPDEITTDKLKQYQTIIVGIRAYNVSKKLAQKNEILLNYVKNGGTLITQYNTTASLELENFTPFKFHLSHNRVTDEDSPVKFLKPNHPVLNQPNEITQKDFQDWVQERGLYFPDKWGPEFKPILSMKDPAGKPLKGSLLIAQYGKGHYVYTGLSFFRELPAGVPGAFRLFANLISLGN